MPREQIAIGNFSKGLVNVREPFVIDNDAFPVLENAISWRGRIIKRRGTTLLGRLQRTFTIGTNGNPGITLSGGSANLFIALPTGQQTTASIAPGTISVVVSAVTYTDPLIGGVYTGNLSPGGTINYATGLITIPGGGSSVMTGSFDYFPGIPVMGLEDFLPTATPGNFVPNLLAFDTTYSYQINGAQTAFMSTSFYKNTGNPVTWNGQPYQQFWTTNDSGALWAVNGNSVLQFKSIFAFTQTSATSANLNIIGHGLKVGDFIWVNETSNATINLLTGQVTAIIDANNVSVQFPDGAIVGNGTGGIAQYLTNSAIPTMDGIRWYDGPTTPGQGWVNFAPPLQNSTVAHPDYLVGAISVLPFKDRLLFFGPTIARNTSSTQGSFTYQYIELQDTVIYSQNGTPFYAGAFNTFSSGQSIFPASFVKPPNPSTSWPTTEWVQNAPGFGGFISAGIPQPIVTVQTDEDVLIIGFSNKQTRLVYTDNDLLPFVFYSINSVMGSSAQFSGINLERGTMNLAPNGGAMTISPYGIIVTDQTSTRRLDLDIPDQVFSIPGNNIGATGNNTSYQRVCAARDFSVEWIYFSVPSGGGDEESEDQQWAFPTQTLLFNYRDNTWAILIENYTTYGYFRETMFGGLTWAEENHTWAETTSTWTADQRTPDYPFVIGGNPEGFVLIRESRDVGEDPSGQIQAITNIILTPGVVYLQITSSNHCLNTSDYIYISGCIGTIGSTINGQIGGVNSIIDANNFTVTINTTNIITGTYLGLGVYTRLCNPFFQTKQFSDYWAQGRKVRIGTQRYLFDNTTEGQLTANLYLSQDTADITNISPYVPTGIPTNDAVIFSNIVFTSPVSGSESAATQSFQTQIWNRVPTSLIGDSVQIGFTLSDSQMRALDTTVTPPEPIYAEAEVVLHGIIIDVSPGPVIAGSIFG